MQFINKHNIKVKISGFKITNEKQYHENQIVEFIDNFFSAKTESIEITKNNIKMFNKGMNGGYTNFIFHTTFNSKDEILTFISTLNNSNLYQNRGK